MTATATLQEPKIKPPREEGDFLVWDDVPVWKEHHSRDFDFDFDKKALEKVVANCNHRIEDTGDYTPIVIRHTEDHAGAADPPVVGLAGPYRLGKYGRKKPLATIFARLRINKKDRERTDDLRRLSVEYWGSKKDPTNGFFDPICLLGAETPELDLGIRGLHETAEDGQLVRYSKQEVELTRVRYQATAAAGANTAVPEVLGDEAEKASYSKEDESMPAGTLSPEDIQQIVSAFEPVLKANNDQLRSEMMASIDEKLTAAGIGSDDDLSNDAPMIDDAMPEGDAIDPAAGEGDPEVQEEPEAVGLPDEAEAEAPPAEVPAAKPAAPPIAAKPGEEAPEKKSKYQADADGEQTVARYKREGDEIRARYQKLLADHRVATDRIVELEAEVAGHRVESHQRSRYSRLAQLASEQGYVLDPTEEAKETADFSDEQFEKHVERILTRYSRLPMGGLPHERPPVKTGAPASQEERARYAKRAAEIYKKSVDDSKPIEWAKCLEDAEKELRAAG